MNIVCNDAKCADQVVQVIECKITHSDQLKLALNDTEHYYSGILASQKRQLYEAGTLKRFSLIKLKKFVVNKGNRQSIVILDAEVVSNDYAEILGRPKPIKLNDNSSAASSNQYAAPLAPSNPPQQEHYAPPPPPAYQPPPPPPAYVPPPPPAYQPPPPPAYQPPPPPPPSYNQNQNQYQNNYNQNHYQQPTYQQPQPGTLPRPAPPTNYPSRPMKTENILPVSVLNNYTNNGWVIKVKVIAIAEPKRYNGRNGQAGKVWSITLKDEAGTVIRGTFFNDTVDRMEGKIRLNAVYRVKSGRIKKADPRFNNTGNDYEITFDDTTTFDEDADDGKISGITFNFTKIDQIAEKPENATVDVIGYVTICDQASSYVSKKGNTGMRRRLELVDETNSKIELTLFGELTNKTPDDPGFVIAVSGARVNTFRGKSLSMFDGTVQINPGLPETNALQAWWMQTGQYNSGEMKSLSSGDMGMSGAAPLVHLSAVDEQGLGMGERPDVVMSYVLLTDLMTNKKFCYPACPNEECKNKGLSENNDGTYFCDKCQQVRTPSWRWMFTAKLTDFSGMAFASVIGNDQVGEMIFNKKVNEVHDEMQGIPEDKIREHVVPLFFKYMKVKLRAKLDNFNSESRVKLNILGASEMDYGEAAKFFASEIEKQK